MNYNARLISEPAVKPTSYVPIVLGIVIDLGNGAETDQMQEQARQFGAVNNHAMHVAGSPKSVRLAAG
ncbi:hypothetical protein [Collimonas arenae]|uniref:hypothetical protein n=1 Tax=Collimonas arenae TaxID=279058 RepID=UPI0012E0AEA5|nr:hypothetical protein [Collimonas arenae]